MVAGSDHGRIVHGVVHALRIIEVLVAVYYGEKDEYSYMKHLAELTYLIARELWADLFHSSMSGLCMVPSFLLLAR